MNVLDGKCEQCGSKIRYLGGNPRKCQECLGYTQDRLTKTVDTPYTFGEVDVYLTEEEKIHLLKGKEYYLEGEERDDI